jgi:hypothetical protein
MDGGDFPPQKVFFEGRHYDAYSFAKKLVRKAAKKIVLVDGYSDEVTLDVLSQKKGGVEVLVATSQKTIDRHLTPVAVIKESAPNCNRGSRPLQKPVPVLGSFIFWLAPRQERIFMR